MIPVQRFHTQAIGAFLELACAGKQGIKGAEPWLCKMLNIRGSWVNSIQNLSVQVFCKPKIISK